MSKQYTNKCTNLCWLFEEFVAKMDLLQSLGQTRVIFIEVSKSSASRCTAAKNTTSIAVKTPISKICNCASTVHQLCINNFKSNNNPTWNQKFRRAIIRQNIRINEYLQLKTRYINQLPLAWTSKCLHQFLKFWNVIGVPHSWAWCCFRSGSLSYSLLVVNTIVVDINLWLPQIQNHKIKPQHIHLLWNKNITQFQRWRKMGPPVPVSPPPPPPPPLPPNLYTKANKSGSAALAWLAQPTGLSHLQSYWLCLLSTWSR